MQNLKLYGTIIIIGVSSFIGYVFLLKKQESQPQPQILQILQNSMKKINKHGNVFKELYNCETTAPLIEPYNYILGTGGKKIRMVIATVICSMFREEVTAQAIQIGGLIQLLHCASLIIDDIEDQSTKRRDQPCAHLVYGNPYAINSANLMYFLPFWTMIKSQRYTASQKKQFIKIFTQQMVICHLGQAEDILMHKLPTQCTQITIKSLSLPSIEQYFRMTSAKTGSLLRMMIGMLSVILDINKDNTNQLRCIMDNIGISFQITDDILNLTTKIGKGQLAQDLYQKKFTLIIHQLRNNLIFMNLFLKKRQNKTQQDINQMLDIIKETGAIDKAKTIAQQYANKAIEGINLIKCKKGKGEFIQLVKFIVQRDK